MENQPLVQPDFISRLGTSNEDTIEYEYSIPLPLHLQTSQFDFAIKPRVSIHAAIADEGCQAARDDWEAMGGDLIAHGCMREESFLNFIAVVIPEAIPERIWAASYASDVGFIHDGPSASILYS
ncbi:uncharacterized protein N7443_010893 [Penicillium atrosanguineum]|uniref:Uncharacterized protein n=1 Tax=Penicillium atrosanguineum TaxID=1132637 RepID=A0A9W9U2R1_9EURO|nr:uncharacterized protein N7443_010893 [Penicillium atrosanguineum]KAJ5141134.1 hypothetical protein N7526_002129 [Penicillium atrosanguineum]KAJ5290640.1 hypothetical protein N7443_010893 [Penicillium atrosanguineum]KAJ5308464.1 hypothetical protein N7476_009120 [Penicillium atrosanguineum]